MDPIQAILIALLITVLGTREYFLYRERQQVYDRLMAKSLPDFKDNETPEPNLPPEEEDDDEGIPMEDAEEELVAQEDYAKN